MKLPVKWIFRGCVLIWSEWWDDEKCINFVCVNQITTNSNTNASTAATNNNNNKNQ